MKDLSLYIHIPFCVKKCNYCDFLSSFCEEEVRETYVETLCKEISEKAGRFCGRKVDTLFFGGGTPSLLSVEQISKIMTVVREHFQVVPEAEISMEVNPGTVQSQKLETYKKLGIHRLSIGLQSADNEELKLLGRIHTWEDFLNTWNMVRKAGFDNVNIDLMSALPGQSVESYERTLRRVMELKPEHISAYSLIIEEGTPFFEWYGEEEPEEEKDRQMYEMTKKILGEMGYERYEISNYALKGYRCKHNIGYWERKEYLGLGLGASSFVSGVRSRNISGLQKYLELGKAHSGFGSKRAETIGIEGLEKEWIEEESQLSREEEMEEFMFLGLRMMEGIRVTEFQKQFGQSLKEVYGKVIKKLVKQELLQWEEKTQSYSLTERGIDVSNQVFVEFMW